MNCCLSCLLVNDARHSRPERTGQERRRDQNGSQRDRHEARAHLSPHEQQRPEHDDEADRSTARLREHRRRHHQHDDRRGNGAPPSWLPPRHRHNRGDRHEGHHVQREVVRIAEDAADGARQASALDEIDAPRVVEDTSRGDIPDADEDQPRQLLEAFRRRQRVHHQDEDQEGFQIRAGELLQRATGPHRERHGRDHDQAETDEADGLRRDAEDRRASGDPMEQHRRQAGQCADLGEMQWPQKRELILRAQEQNRGERQEADVAPVAAAR